MTTRIVILRQLSRVVSGAVNKAWPPTPLHKSGEYAPCFRGFTAESSELPGEPPLAVPRITEPRRSATTSASVASTTGGLQGRRNEGPVRLPPLPSEAPRVHPLRLFYPGQTYKPDELEADVGGASYVHKPANKTRSQMTRSRSANVALFEQADFRAGRLLSAFVSEAGKLLPRRNSKVDAKVQRKLTRAVKTARMMALLPYTSRLPSLAKAQRR